MSKSSPRSVGDKTPERISPAGAAPDPTDQLQIDPHEADDASDADSAFGSDASTTSTSITSSVLNYVYENGRRYHAFREGEYLLPNDEREQDRLDLNHHVFRSIVNGQLFRAPIPSNPHRVLDLATGTGLWAIDFADEFPSATVIGNDLSPIQPTWVPPNCKFIVDDLESDWGYAPEEHFDFIHGRSLGGAVRDWDALLRQARENLKDGGWFELQQPESWMFSDDDPELVNSPSALRWCQLVDEASTQFGKRVLIAPSLKQRFLDAGFEDVRDDIYKIPVGPWALDPKLKEMGMYELQAMLDAVDSFTPALLTRVLKWTHEEAQVLMAQVRHDFRNRKNHLYVKLHFVYGRKAASAE